MGAFADSLFAVLMSWVRALVNSIWALFSSENTTLLEFLGKNWLLIVVVLIAAGLVIDWLIWLIRWRPYTLWAQRVRRLLRIAPPQEEDEERSAAREAAYAPEQEEAPAQEGWNEAADEEEEDWLPEQPVFEAEEEQEVLSRAEAVPDEELGVYPGMRYDEQARTAGAQDGLSGTRRYAAVHNEGPGAAEVSRRRAEIDAWQKHMQEEARIERERRVEAMRRAEEERLAEEARAAEAARIAEEERLAEEARIAEEARLEEEARMAEEARAAQEEYQRQLAEYERQKAQYERELAQYQRDMAAYEAAMAAQRQADAETAQEIAPAQSAKRTRARRRPVTYSDMVEGETVEELPATPEWPQMDETVSAVKKSAADRKKPVKSSGFIGRMAHLIEPEREEIAGVSALPPRVDMRDAYKPAAKPGAKQTRRRK